ncbi:MAG: hypothetical protein Q9162_003462 [Coniocarpon cinnabarinum]
MSKPRVLYWFRTDLPFYPVWCWDPHYVYRARVGPNRFQFLLDCQNDLSASLAKLNKKQKLHVVREGAQTILPKLFKAWKITHLVFEKDVDAYARDRDDSVIESAQKAGVELIVRHGRTLWDSDDVVKQNRGKPTMSITQLQQAGQHLGEIARPLSAPKSIPDPGKLSLDDVQQDKPPQDPDFNHGFRNHPDKGYDSLAGPKGDFAVPTLGELGMEATTPHRGGETRALEELARLCKDEAYVATFQKPSTAPTAFNPRSTTVLSPHLHFGSLSVREFYWRVEDICKRRKDASAPPASLNGQLFFRDMYFAAQAALGYHMAQTYGNTSIKFVPWHLPSRIDKSNHLITGTYDVDNKDGEQWYRRWKWGRTGFPWIDAIMRQLRQEGWIHHLARHAVACFLTRGGCYVDWERGAEVFEEFLIDHETACNSGNWQWLSCTAFESKYYRVYSPISFPQKTDKEGAYVRHYVPELKNFDKKYIYEPWKAPIADQKKWGCLVRGDGGYGQGEDAMKGDLPEEEGKQVYPKPMFDFGERRNICQAGMHEAYQIKLMGADKEVMEGTWRKRFDDAAEGPTEGSKGPPGAMVEDDDGTGELDAHERVEGHGKKHQRSESGGKGQGKLDGHMEKKAKK